MSASSKVKLEGVSPEASSSKGSGEKPKVACSRCRSLKAKCSGPVSGGDKCAKCLKAGKDCTMEAHRRGRKVGTRLSDPTKALMRMKSAFEIITNSQKEGKGIDLDIPEDLAILASSVSSSALVLPSSTISPASGSSSTSPLVQQPESSRRNSSASASTSASPAYHSPLPPPPLNHFQPSPNPSLPRFQLPPPLPSGSNHPSTSSIPNYLLPRPEPPAPSFHLPSHLQPHQPTYPSYPAHLLQQHYSPAPLPPFPAQFKDLGPSSRSSPSLARLFAMKPPEDEKKHSTELDLWRQDPVQLGYLTEATSRSLFDLFHSCINPRICILDQNLHTHDYVRGRSQLLFAVILSVALKFSPHGDPVTRSRCLALARDQILRIISDDTASAVESVQALLLMVEYKEPTDEQAYVLLGIGCRLAMDLDCGQTLPQPEILNRNRLRTWFASFNADRRFGGCGQVSKPTIMPEDATIRNSSTFHRNPMATPYDARLIAAVHLRRLMSRYDILLKSNSERPGGNESTPIINLRDLFLSVSHELEDWGKFWTNEIRTMNPNGDTLQLILNQEHGKLQIAHHWLFQAFRFPNLHSAEEWEMERREALAACLGGSCRVLKLMCTVPNLSLSYSPDSTHLFYSYATFFLHKMFKARLLEIQLFDSSSISSIFDIIRQAAEKLESATLDPSHTIALHASLLRSLLTFTPRGSPAPRSSPGASLPPPPTFNLATNPKLVPPVPSSSNPVYFPPPSNDPLPDQRYTHGSGSMFRSQSAEEGRGLSTPTSAMRGGEEVEQRPAPSPKVAAGPEGEDWNELWMEGGVFDGMLGNANLGELDFAFFDFHPPD